ncbi:MAG: DUF3800 domain-containing protein [Candidatus Methanoplasma sp.]|jgi:hypothetical protein|nr:DUF3800 domain-containing protein [Candidatus Methanoplasma sp.]
MTWVISIDESGNLGHESRYFVMIATIVMRPRHLSKVSKLIPKTQNESKFHNSPDDMILSIISEFSNADVRVVYVAIDKHNQKSLFYGCYGNDLYKKVLNQVLKDSMSILSGTDINVFLDRSSFVKLDEFRAMSAEIAIANKCNLKRCEKVTSHHNKCIQIADYIAGSVRLYYESDDDKFITIMKEKISVARKY